MNELKEQMDLDDEEVEEKVEHIAEKGMRFFQRHWQVLLVLAVVLTLVMQTARLTSAKAERAEMKATIERQNEVIDGLTKDVDEKDKFIKDNVPVITSETLKEQLNAVCDLVTEEYAYHNADKLEQNQSWLFGWTRPFSTKSALVTYDGIIKAGVDLSRVMPEVDEEKHTITIALPASRITDNNIPQESIQVVEIKNGLFNPVTIKDYNEFISQQKAVMQEKAIDQGILEKADQNAQNVIRTLLSALPGMSEYTLVIK